MRKGNHFEYTLRLYLNANGKRVLGKGGAQILEAIEDCGSISAAAEELGMSYKFVWDYLTRIRRILKIPIVVTYRGGAQRHRKGGGGATLTPFARKMLEEFHSTETELKQNLIRRRISLAKVPVITRMKPRG
ncbi:MAG: winged helix-turn-helix domain-containing protein [Candidatus Bathyarchaeia archaeon]